MHYTRRQLQETQNRSNAANVAIAINNNNIRIFCKCCNSVVTLRTFISHQRNVIAPISSSLDPQVKRSKYINN